jgi:hypothetical protein
MATEPHQQAGDRQQWEQQGEQDYGSTPEQAERGARVQRAQPAKQRDAGLLAWIL